MLTLRLHESIADIDACDWDALVVDDHPFVSHAFLSGLERTGCIRADYGWHAQHLTLHNGDALVGALPLYLKSNSHGEFVFDWSWADAWQRAGSDYYPKLLCGVPYSPVTGPRLLVGKTGNAARRTQLVQALQNLTLYLRLSSAHVNFLRDDELHAFANDWLARSDWQFHWRNEHGWRDFADFLDALTHKRRASIRRERAQVAQDGIECEWRAAGELSDREWRAMHDFYVATYDNKSNTPTLTPGFFRYLGATLPAQTSVAFARRGRRIVAGALFLHGAHTLYGRYWGAREPVPSLHFELCYYQGIEYCLRAGLQIFEPGAQGEHKLARGFLPVRTHSRHYLAEPCFREAVRDALAREARTLDAYGEELRTHSPFAQRGTAA